MIKVLCTALGIGVDSTMIELEGEMACIDGNRYGAHCGTGISKGILVSLWNVDEPCNLCGNLTLVEVTFSLLKIIQYYSLP